MINLQRELMAQVKFTPEELEEVLEYFSKITLVKGEKILFPGRVAEDIGFVDSGCLMLIQQFEESFQIVELFSKNYFFTEVISFLKRTPSEFTIEAAVDSIIYVLSRKHSDELCEKMHNWERFMRLHTERICLYLALECLEVKLNTNEERYQRLLVDRPFLFQELPQYIIANYLVMTPVGLSKLRKRLARRK